MKSNIKKNRYYVDPLDQWVEDHPFVAAAMLGVCGWLFIVLMVTLAWEL